MEADKGWLWAVEGEGLDDLLDVALQVLSVRAVSEDGCPATDGHQPAIFVEFHVED
jgi:hypothetical protein